MTAAGVIARLVWGALAIAGLSLIVAHHVGYFRKRRPLTFGASVGDSSILERGPWRSRRSSSDSCLC
ncbi:MAG: hypothetical protein AUI83_09240 [Armatimonadetes bacterium 13_1_40CM_3_65_7]|nr:MAG: hypothetical protein AUI83_09240 [Armatimonadetes bacterium 13_1_40CM_3_65_7]